MDEIMRRKLTRLRQAAERHEPGLYAKSVYWRDLLDVVEHVEHQDRELREIEQLLARMKGTR